MTSKPTYEELEQRVKEHKKMEAALRKERAKARRYLDIAGVIIVAIGAEGLVTLINKKGCEILGYNSDEIIGKNWFDTFVPKTLRSEVRKVFRKIVNGDLEPVEYFQNPVLTKNGEELILEWHNAMLRNDKGKIVGTLSSGNDITRRKEVEEELRAANEELEKKVEYRTADLKAKTVELEETNVALRVLLKQRRGDRAEIEEEILSNVKELVLPYAEKIKKGPLGSDQETCLTILKSNLESIVSPFSKKLSPKYSGLTPKEIHIANLVKDGKTTKEIAELFEVSYRTIEAHRNRIRTKIGIKNKKQNLRSYLLSM